MGGCEISRLQFGLRHLLVGITVVAVVLGACLALGQMAILIAMWIAFSAAVGAFGHWMVRRFVSQDTHWYEFGLFSALIGVLMFPFVVPWVLWLIQID